MHEVNLADGVATALDSLINDRLALLAGAGLSMAPPSSLPSAAAIAWRAKQKYDGLWGGTRAPLAAGIEEQAEFFFQRSELETVYFRTLVDQHAFAGQPNSGHYAAADLLLVRAIQTAVTTNVDTLIETAGQLLHGHIGAGIDQEHVAVLPPDVVPLLKVHGCRNAPESMVWAPGQLNVEPFSSRIAAGAAWLSVRLLDRDLLIVGYSTDWDYLNEVLGRTMGTIRPARVVVVDPIEGAEFARKAPNLYALGQRATVAFQHVRASGAEFMDDLRLGFSKSYVRRVLYSATEDYQHTTGQAPDPAWTQCPDADNTTLWQVRRDLEGRVPNEPARERVPPQESLVGLTLLQLQAAGAVSDGPYWVLNGHRIRVLRAANKPLHRVKQEFEREMAPAVAPDVIVAVGAEAQELPSNIARATGTASIARGNPGRWLTRTQAVTEFAL